MSPIRSWEDVDIAVDRCSDSQEHGDAANGIATQIKSDTRLGDVLEVVKQRQAQNQEL